jgi:hypothetical protein
MNTMDIESNVFAEGNDSHPGMYAKLRHVYEYTDPKTLYHYRWVGLHMDMPDNIIITSKWGNRVTVNTADAVFARHLLTTSAWHFRRLLRDLLGVNAPKDKIEYFLEPVAEETEYDLPAVPVAGMEWVDQDTEGICFDLNCDLIEYNAEVYADLVAEIAEQRAEACYCCRCGPECELEGEHHVEINRLVDERHAARGMNDTVTSVIVVLSLAAFPIALRIAEMLAKA